MEPITILRGTAAPLMRANVDTDAIIPSREMTQVGKSGLGTRLFANWRYTEDRKEREEFILNRAPYRSARILLAGENFGCGSSREGAVWALVDFGIRAIIAPSFGSIFRANCIRNGLLPVVLSADIVASLAHQMEASAGAASIVINLETLTVTDANGREYPFELTPLQRQMLLAGLDSVGLALHRIAEVDAFHETLRRSEPWLFSIKGESRRT